MIKFIKPSIILISLVLVATLSVGQTLLTAIPADDLVDYYSISIDGVEFKKQPNINLDFLYRLDELQDGTYQVKIVSGSYESGESDFVSFSIKKETIKKWIHYTITDIDKPEHFDEPTYIKVRNPNYETELILELQDEIKKLKEDIEKLMKGDFDLDGDTDGSDLAHFNLYFGK